MKIKSVFITRAIAFLWLLMPAGSVYAQGKAYEKVQYSARLNNVIIKLNYGEGYLAASEIRITKLKKTIVFLPDSGSPEANGNLNFYSKNASNSKTYIVLKNVDELSEAPENISGVYYLNGIQKQLLFKRIK